MTVQAMKAGAIEFLTKPLDVHGLSIVCCCDSFKPKTINSGDLMIWEIGAAGVAWLKPFTDEEYNPRGR